MAPTARFWKDRGVQEGRNVGVVRRVFDALSQRDVPALLELAAPDIEFFAPATAALTRQGRSYRGHDGIMRYMRDVGRVWDELELIPNSFHESGEDQVIVRGRLRARGRSGVLLDEGANWLVQLHDGKIISSRPLGTADSDTAELKAVAEQQDRTART
jgi:ketosteroid isomerase-like protein